MIDDALHFLTDGLESPDWGRLGQHLPFAWIEEAVVCAHAVSIRHRRLPAEQLVWLVIALALYRHKSIGEVLDDLGLALPDAERPFISKSAAAQARQRLGPDPLQWLFERSALAWCAQDLQQYALKGLQLFAMAPHCAPTTQRTIALISVRKIMPAGRLPVTPKCAVSRLQRCPPT